MGGPHFRVHLPTVPGVTPCTYLPACLHAAFVHAGLRPTIHLFACVPLHTCFRQPCGPHPWPAVQHTPRTLHFAHTGKDKRVIQDPPVHILISLCATQLMHVYVYVGAQSRACVAVDSGQRDIRKSETWGAQWHDDGGGRSVRCLTCGHKWEAGM